MDYNYENSKSNKIKLLKNIIPKSGSYDFNNTPLTTDNGTLPLKHNNKKLITYNRKMSPQTAVKFPASKFDLNTSFFGKIFPKYKRSLVGVPLLCLAYFSAVYTMISYGAISALSIYQIIYGDLSNMYPLFLLVIGYIAMTFMSLLLIVAIYKEMLNFVASWIIVISVFILPEIGLNILLANNSLNWFNTSTGFYTLVILIVRISFNLPCIFFILFYHINLTKKNIYLKNIMMPLKDSIINGDVLKIYNSIKIDNFDMPGNVYQSLPAHLNSDTSQDLSYINESKLTVKNNPSLKKAVNANTYFYRFSPYKNYSVKLKPTQTEAKSTHVLQQSLNGNKTYDMNALHLIWDNTTLNNTLNNAFVNSSTEQREIISNNNNFEYLRRIEQNFEAEANQIFKIPIIGEENCKNDKTKYRSLQVNETYSSANQISNKTLSLANHQIYLPPSGPASQGYTSNENNYVKIARSFQI